MLAPLMSRCTLISVLCLCLYLCVRLSVAGAEESPSHADTLECDWQQSRAVRNILMSDVFPALHSAGFALPPSCPLRQDADILLALEKSQVELTTRKWACSICLRQFDDDRTYIDRHMAMKHADRVPKSGRGRVCLADFADVFGVGDFNTGMGMGVGRMAESAAKKLKFKCQMLINQCFGSSKALSGRFNAEWCGGGAGLDRHGRSNRAASSMWSQFKLVMGIMLIIILVVFYVAYYLLMKVDADSVAGLRSRSGHSRGAGSGIVGAGNTFWAWLRSWRPKKKKLKGY